MAFQKITIPAGEKITVNRDNSLNVPNQPIIPFIEGDGTGADIWAEAHPGQRRRARRNRVRPRRVT